LVNSSLRGFQVPGGNLQRLVGDIRFRAALCRVQPKI